MKDCKGVIFDFNGTLFFDNEKHMLAWGKMSELIRNQKLSQQQLHMYCNGRVNKEVVRYLCNDTFSEEELDKYSHLKEEYYRKYCKEDQKTFHLVKGSEEFFDFLKQANIPFTIASASIQENITFFVKNFALANWFNLENIVYDDGSYKDKVAMFLKASELLKVNIEDVYIFEDSMSGIEAARLAGCKHIIVVNSAKKKELFEKQPCVIGVIEDFDEINQILKEE